MRGIHPVCAKLGPMESSLLISSSFHGATQLHGGSRRCLQIKELAENLGFQLQPASRGRRFGPFRRYFEVVKLSLRHHLAFHPSRYALGTAGELALDYNAGFKAHPGSKVLLWEDTTRYFVPFLAKQAGYKVVALPQNFESLVQGQHCPFSRRNRPGRWQLELAGLAQADRVFCISREEQWLLNVWGVHTDYLGYFPPAQILRELRQVRRWRETGQPANRFLLMGTVLNPPTREGMEELLRWMHQLRQNLEFELDVAGFGTESLVSHVQHPDFRLHGPISDSHLNELLAQTRGLIAFQRNGLGVLTRIPEMLVAGVPVLANAHAGRSYLGVPGVHCFENPRELLELLSIPPTLPPAPQQAPGEINFADCLRELTGRPG